jgi:protein arginine kinase activator
MICTNCKKNPATVHFKSVINGQTTQWDLCAVCAKDKGVSFVWDQEFSLSPAPFASLSETIAQLAGSAVQESRRASAAKCSKCGLTYAEFQQKGRLGCDGCYDSFRAMIEPLLQHIHGHARHAGKASKAAEPTFPRAPRTVPLESLQKQLKEAVKKEDFEKAAELRDKIKKHKEKSGG